MGHERVEPAIVDGAVKHLLDTCVWGGARGVLAASGHEVVWVGECQWNPGDDEILAHAFAESRVLVTLDKAFGELAVVRQQRHSGIIRLVSLSARQQAPAARVAETSMRPRVVHPRYASRR